VIASLSLRAVTWLDLLTKRGRLEANAELRDALGDLIEGLRSFVLEGLTAGEARDDGSAASV
jgi:hypothetical protein